MVPVRPRPSAAIAWIAALLLPALIGCGGGSGGASSGPVPFGRSFLFTSNSQVVALTVDPLGRYTIFAQDPVALPAGTAAQGTETTDGKLYSQNSDGTVQFTATEAPDGSTVTGTVRTGTATIPFTAILSAARATTANLAGTFLDITGATTLLLTVDPLGSGTLYGIVGSVSGGGLIQVSPTGTVSSADGRISGQLTVNNGTGTLQLNTLNGTAVNRTITLNQAQRAKWTFMVYLNAANNLQEFGPLNVNQMEQVGSTGNVNIVVQWKQAACATCGTPDWVGTRRYYITHDTDTGTVNSQLVQNLGSGVDMGDWHTLNSFITWAQQRYPADHYALVIWNHGAGWRPTRSAPDRRAIPFPRSVSIDDSTNNEIETWELPMALNVTPKLDMVIFDASLMQMMEVAYEIRNVTPLVVGSEESPPGEGYPYNTFLADLAANPSMSPADFGARIAIDTLQSYGTNSNITQSVVDTSKLPTLAQRLNTFAASLDAHIGDSRAAEVLARNTAQNYAYPENKDLWDYANIIKANTAAADLQQAASGVQAAIQQAVLTEQHGTINGNSHGIAIYVPDPLSYLSAYANLALARDTLWAKWLQDQPQN
ncbi:MAG: clostripain-related cysteine peptidase [Chthonomonadales bacterium]